jgi:ATP-binding cassette subfamily F protein 3
VRRFEGGVLIVSHDQYFVSKVANEVRVIDGGRVFRVESFDAYKRSILKTLSAR